MTTTTESPPLQAIKAETDFTGVASSENLAFRKLTSESSPLKKGDSPSNKDSTDPESLKVSEVKPESHPAGYIPEVEMTPAQLRKHKLDGLRVVLGGALMHLVLGTFYLWGSVSVYVASFLRARDPSIDINLVKLVYPLMLFAINFAMPFGVRLSYRFGAKIVCIFAMAVIVIAVFVSGFMTSFGGLVVFYGIIFGFGNGIIYMIPVTCGWKYFPHRKGMVSGVIIGAFGFGTLIFNYVALAVVNPDNKSASVVSEGSSYFTSDIYDKVPEMFKVLAGCYLVIGMAGALLVTYPKAVPKGYPTPGQIQQSKGQSKVDPTNGKREVDTVLEGLKTWSFPMLLALTAFASFYGLMLSNNYKVYGMTTIGDDLFLTTVGSVGSACNGISRFIWASLMDKFGYKRVFLVMLIIQLIICGTFVSISHVKALYLIWYMISMSCEGACLAMQPTITAKVFGPKKSSLIYAFVYFGFSVANLCAFFLTKYGQKTMGWGDMFWTCFGISAVPVVLILIFNEYPTFGPKKEEAKQTAITAGDDEKRSISSN